MVMLGDMRKDAFLSFWKAFDKWLCNQFYGFLEVISLLFTQLFQSLEKERMKFFLLLSRYMGNNGNCLGKFKERCRLRN